MTGTVYGRGTSKPSPNERPDRSVFRPLSASTLVLAVFLSVALRAFAQNADKPSGETITAPGMTNRRYDEDYSYLSDPKNWAGAWWGPFKYIPLHASGTSFLTLGLEMRLREEAYRNFGWGKVPVDNYQWYRILPYADLHLGPNLRLFGQAIGAWSTGKESPNTGVDKTGVELLQGFVDLKLPLTPDADLTLRGGRQLLSYGSERLISLRYGPNVVRSFDAGLASLATGHWRVDAFVARPVRNRIDSLDDRFNRNRSVWALYATRNMDEVNLGAGFDLYYIGYSNEKASFNQGDGREERHTLGSRFFGKAQGWDWNFEAMLQFGRFGAGNIAAWSIASDTGYTFADMPFSPRLGLTANVISGDRNPANPDLQTFNPLFPKGKYFGETGLIGPYNLVNLHPNLKLQLDDEWTLSSAAVFYWRESLSDGVYDTGGGLVRASNGSTARHIGTQFDIVLGWEPVRWFNAELAYSVFVPGQFIPDTGPSRTTHFVRLEASVKF